MRCRQAMKALMKAVRQAGERGAVGIDYWRRLRKFISHCHAAIIAGIILTNSSL